MLQISKLNTNKIGIALFLFESTKLNHFGTVIVCGPGFSALLAGKFVQERLFCVTPTERC
ncbi:hypothetical protein GIB67_011155 [Kingdonia uniflora]|uniref:Uncharacterized protein n=1 Tax=Kingdonia uniflora TaxID=39325 RepID=A0A7J7PAC3_9MAGN|nr:hypothetical protein GIB67_011155 [Kingdonia uniflora]